ncbi:hypothetical protein LTS10_013134 [Elasticomyces elasticus]|nr:hypothetical protein LTS10_013134 [Elasticomyces elasticus]
MHAQDDSPAYPLSGIILSGMGHQEHPNAAKASSPGPSPTFSKDYITRPVDQKDSVMFGPDTVAQAILAESERLNHPIPTQEVVDMEAVWIPHWRHLWAGHVVVPVMFALAELDKFFLPTRSRLEECMAAFSRSPGVDGSLVAGAPHCIGLSHWSSGWYARCFGFAMECAVTYGIAELTLFD